MRNYRGWSRIGKNENKLTVVQISNIQFNLLSTSSSSVSMIIRLGVDVAVGARRWAVIIVIIIVASASAMGEQSVWLEKEV